MNPFLLFALAFKASLFSTGGFGNVPSLHSDLLARGLATEKTFADALAVGQISPGPNGLWTVSLGYLVGGWVGSFAALLAVAIPPFLVLAWQKLYARVHHHPFVEGFMRGLSLAVVGIFAFVLVQLMGSVGVSVKTVGILALSFGLGVSGRVPVIVILAIAAILGSV